MLSLPCLTMCIKNVLTWWGTDLHWINKGLSTGSSKIHKMTSSSSSFFYYAADLPKPGRVNLTLLFRSFGLHSTPLAIIWSSLSKENRIYIRVEFRQSLGMNFVSPFQPEREFKVYKSCKCSQIICSRVHVP